ncbi:Hypothetical protein R9X50_00534300 [Acrodontium crateriforme]|uniref:Uncharacterized protein n=1 Tax=Acrodontium crateriforme TaxID=150365 RepID=A0AAQ3M6C0_9PEZI|nr:Hypothetical protein R9X50_00534300 [Acrodontium crateriforme]
MADQMTNGMTAANADVVMTEETAAEALLDSNTTVQPDLTDPNPPPQPATTLPATAPEHLSSIQPVAASTPPAFTSGSTRTGSMPPQPTARPDKPVAHGGPTRQYLNQHVTPHLLEGMKFLAAQEPDKPLQWLANFLMERSKEVEG